MDSRPIRAGRPYVQRLLSGLLGGLIWLLVILPAGMTLIYRFTGPPLTPLMLIRLGEGQGIERKWIPLNRISPSLPRAVIAAEDSHYCTHHGFDFEAMQKAMASNARHPTRLRGGSTISQQTAKNVFLWPGRSLLRKGFEAYFTVLIELGWGKRRIMEVYLNSIEWGPGIYGVDAAARANFGIGADHLSPVQAARLAAILPSPLKWQADTPGPYIRKRSRRIGSGAQSIRSGGLDSCLK